MIQVESARQTKTLLGEKYPKGKARGNFPQQRHVITHEKDKMKGLVNASGLNTQQIFDEKARGEEYKGDVNKNPDYYKNEP